MKVYVVMFTFNGYDDNYSEIIGVYDSKENAQKKLKEEMEDIRFNSGYYDDDFYYDKEITSDILYIAQRDYDLFEKVEIIEKDIE